MGITATVVTDTETRDGELVEQTADWFAQDRGGNVWYLGEDIKAFENGQPSPAGSWEAGVDGALPGIIMKAHPQVGDAYRQEFYRGEAEDMGKVVRVGDTETVPFRSFRRPAGDRGLGPAGAQGHGGEVLRQGGRPGAGDDHPGWLGTERAGQLPIRRIADCHSAVPAVS
jgi:hypothetical protein